MSEVKLDWATAQVVDAKLEVALDGQPSKDWKQSFETTSQLLGGGEWGALRLKKQMVTVQDVAPGAEEKLRHYLESVVEQANAAGAADESEAQSKPSEDDGENDERGPDAEMSKVFQSFASPERDGERTPTAQS